MPAFTFTADSATDQLAITAHGLVTGDGDIAVRNVGGALPGGLGPVIGYKAIRVDDNHLKLATSSSNAMAGIAVDITSAGTGTNILEIGLPYRRPRTAANGQMVFSSDLNSSWDSLVALHGLLTGQSQAIWDGVTLAIPLAMAADLDISLSGTGDLKHGDRSLSLHAGAWHAAGNNSLSTPRMSFSSGTLWFGWDAAPNNLIVAGVPMRPGDRIKSIVWHYNKAGSSSAIQMQLAINEDGDPGETVVSDTDTTTSGTTKTTVIGHTVAEGEAISLKVSATVASIEFHGCKITYDRP